MVHTLYYLPNVIPDVLDPGPRISGNVRVVLLKLLLHVMSFE